MSIILDLIIVGIVVTFIYFGIKNGLVRTTVELLGLIAIIILGSKIADFLADCIFNAFIVDSIADRVNNIFENSGDSGLTTAINDFFDGLPVVMSGSLASHNVTAESLSEAFISDNIEFVTESVVSLLKPPIVAFISLVLAAIIFMVGAFLVKWLSKLCDKLVSMIPLVSEMNKILGATVGGLKGLAISIGFVWLLAAIIGVTANGFVGVTPEVIDKTYIFRLINIINPIL